jgi:hypothetical protein
MEIQAHGNVEVSSIQKAVFAMLIFGVLATGIKGSEQFKLSRLNPQSRQIRLCLWSVYSLVALNISLVSSFITYVLYVLDGFHPDRTSELPIALRIAICANFTIAYATILLEVFATLLRFNRSHRVTGDGVKRDRVFKWGKIGIVVTSVLMTPAAIINNILYPHWSFLVIHMLSIGFQISLDFYLNYKVYPHANPHSHA